MKDQKELITHINESLRKLCYPEQPTGLFDPIRYILDLGGKR
ncbi:MAG: polyprenyl synthetase family protein, partial [Bacteroidales bacterium]